MTKSGTAGKKLSGSPKGSVPSTEGEQVCQPLKPLPTLFKVLLVGFALWLGVLLTLYYKTVYPLRHAPSTDAAAATRPGASALPSAPR
jgi:hypothetical protein